MSADGERKLIGFLLGGWRGCARDRLEHLRRATPLEPDSFSLPHARAVFTAITVAATRPGPVTLVEILGGLDDVRARLWIQPGGGSFRADNGLSEPRLTCSHDEAVDLARELVASQQPEPEPPLAA